MPGSISCGPMRLCAEAQFPVRALRPLKIRVLTVGKSREPGVRLLVAEYSKSIQRYCSFEVAQVRSNPKNSSDVKVQMEAESDGLMRSISTKDWVVVLDEKGRETTSHQLAALIADTADSAPSSLVFCIGGPYGHGSGILARANTSLRLSTMVLNHQVALIVLLEQIYRAWTILRNEKYHH